MKLFCLRPDILIIKKIFYQLSDNTNFNWLLLQVFISQRTFNVYIDLLPPILFHFFQQGLNSRGHYYLHEINPEVYSISEDYANSS